MCVGDIDHGRDGFYRREMEEAAQAEDYERWQEEQEQEP
jgi:hypothetical protein